MGNRERARERVTGSGPASSPHLPEREELAGLSLPPFPGPILPVLIELFQSELRARCPPTTTTTTPSTLSLAVKSDTRQPSRRPDEYNSLKSLMRWGWAGVWGGVADDGIRTL